MMPTKPDRLQAVALGLRAFQFSLSLIITAIFLHLLSSSSLPASSSIKADMGVPLVFVFVALIHSIIAGGLTLYKKDRILSAILDLVCLCGFVVTTVLMQGIASGYNCPGWLSSSHTQGGETGTPMLRKRSKNGAECGLLRGIFGMAIIGCILLLVTFMLGVYMARRNNGRPSHHTTKSRHAEEGRMAERKNAPQPPRPDTSNSVNSHSTETRAFHK